MEQISLFGEEISVEAKVKKFETLLKELQQSIEKRDMTIKQLQEENRRLKFGVKEDISSIYKKYIHMYYEEADRANYLQSELNKAISLFKDDYTLSDISKVFFYIKHKDIKFELASKEAGESFKKLYYRLADLYREEFEINEQDEYELNSHHAKKIFDEAEIIEI